MSWALMLLIVLLAAPAIRSLVRRGNPPRPSGFLCEGIRMPLQGCLGTHEPSACNAKFIRRG